MALSKADSDLDLKQIKEFMDENRMYIPKGDCIDLMGGSIERCGNLLS